MSKRILTAVVLAGVMMTSGAAIASERPKMPPERREPPKELKVQRPPMMSRDERVRPPMPHDNKHPRLSLDKRPPIPPRSRDRRPPEPRGVAPRQ